MAGPAQGLGSARVELVLTQIDNNVALITVNDPDRRNAVTFEMSAGLRAAIESVGPTPTCTR